MNPTIEKLSVQEIANLLGGEGITTMVSGKSQNYIDKICDINQTAEHGLYFYYGSNPAVLKHITESIILCYPDVKPHRDDVTLIHTPDPRLSFIIIANQFKPPPPTGIHPTAIVDRSCEIAPGASIGAYSVLSNCVVGENTIIQPYVHIMANTSIGKNVTIEAHACIGQTGQSGAKAPNGKIWSMPQFGGTQIGDNCFIGSLVTIVRGALADTIIEKNCKIVHGTKIGHNVRIGEETFVSNSVAIGGSTIIGKNCMIGTNAGLRDHITLPDNTTVGLGSAVVRSYAQKGLTLVGVPAKPLNKE